MICISSRFPSSLRGARNTHPAPPRLSMTSNLPAGQKRLIVTITHRKPHQSQPLHPPLTTRPRLLHYIHSRLAWFARTFRRHRHKGYGRLGDAFTTLPSEQPRPQPPHTLTHPGGGPRPPRPPEHGGALRTPRARGSERARARARTRARTRAHAHRALPGPGVPNKRAFLMACTRGWPFPP